MLIVAGNPEVPECFEDESEVVMREFAGQIGGFLRRDPWIEAALQHGRLRPGHRMHREIRDAFAQSGVGKLPQHANSARHHLAFAEAGEPDAQIQRVRHRVILARRATVPSMSVIQSLRRHAEVDNIMLEAAEPNTPRCKERESEKSIRYNLEPWGMSDLGWCEPWERDSVQARNWRVRFAPEAETPSQSSADRRDGCALLSRRRSPFRQFRR